MMLKAVVRKVKKKEKTRCIVPGCKNSSKTVESNIVFYRFPTNNLLYSH